MIIRDARREEFEALGQLMVAVYSGLEGFPGKAEQPKYYELLANIGRVTEQPDTRLLVAVTDRIVGGIVYFADMIRYGAPGASSLETNTAGFRLLAVDPAARGMGVGKGLANRCIELARQSAHRQVIIHTTHAMKIAWAMYEQLGFHRAPELDFMQEQLQVFGFRLAL
jgi:GNAT superfamily N-acetyltransferase